MCASLSNKAQVQTQGLGANTNQQTVSFTAHVAVHALHSERHCPCLRGCSVTASCERRCVSYAIRISITCLLIAVTMYTYRDGFGVYTIVGRVTAISRHTV